MVYFLTADVKQWQYVCVCFLNSGCKSAWACACVRVKCDISHT